jgi:hypothetical protein
MPVVGFFRGTLTDAPSAFRQSLKEAGFVQGQNVRNRIPLGI